MREKQADRLHTTVQEEVELTGPVEVPKCCWVQTVKMNENTPCAAHVTAVTRPLATCTAPDATRAVTQQHEVWATNAELFLPLTFAQSDKFDEAETTL